MFAHNVSQLQGGGFRCGRNIAPNKKPRMDVGVDEAQPVMVVRGPRPMAYFDGGPHVDDQKGDYEFWMLESECKPIRAGI